MAVELNPPLAQVRLFGFSCRRASSAHVHIELKPELLSPASRTSAETEVPDADARRKTTCPQNSFVP